MVLGMPFSHFLYRITSEPFVVLKTAFLYWWIKLLGRRFDLYNCLEKDDLTKNDVYIPAIEYQLEKPQRLLKPKDQESIFFYGGNTSGDVLVARVSRQRECNIPWLHLGLSDGRTYDLPCPEKSYPAVEDFQAAGLRVKCLLPMRKWRISFNGLLREHKTGQKDSTIVHVRFSFVCKSSSSEFDLSTDIHPTVLADYLVRSGKSAIPSNPKSVLSYLDSYVQAVMFWGTICVDASNEMELYLWGARKRSQDTALARSEAHLQEFFGYSRDGQLIYSGNYLLPGTNIPLPFGFYVERSSLSWPVTSCESICKSKQSECDGMKIHIQTERSSVSVTVEAPKLSVEFCDYNVQVKCSITKFTLEDEDFGHGILLDSQWSRHLSDVFEKPSWTLEDPAIVNREKQLLVLSLSDSDCQDAAVSGGKGSSLAVLTHLTQKYKTVFQVPSGFVVTTEAYREFWSLAGAKQLVSLFEKEVWSYDMDKIKDICSQLVTQVSNAKLPESTRNEIERQMKDQFSNNIAGKRFAIRSSATGEDSEEMSAAGQMASFLGIEGLENIYKKIASCWSSQFSFSAIQYKRQNGQELNSPMAVVVQEMVPADTAGVLFTCDPVTGNPQNITITANYGLGESVVSASADPDTIVFERDEKNRLSLKSIQKGKKSLMIVMADEGATVEKKVDESAADLCCLSEKLAAVLAETGLKIEAVYGLPLDIEWAFLNNILYILQARPVTTVDVETRFEIANTSNSTFRAENEYHTKANVGEVMPGFTSHLGHSFFSIYLGQAMKELYGHRNKYAFSFNPYFYNIVSWMNQIFISIPNIILRSYLKGSAQSFLASANIVATFGRDLENEEMFDQADKRNRMYPPVSGRSQLFYVIKDMMFGGRTLRAAVDRLFHLETSYSHCVNSKEVFEKIWRSSLRTTQAFVCHFMVSTNSAICNTVMMGMLAQENQGWDAKVFGDFSKIMSSCGNLESANIPKSIAALSKEILKSIDQAELKKMTTEEILSWLETTKTSAGELYREFIRRHGHRCANEIDIYKKPWRADRLPIIKMLQDSLSSLKERDEDVPSISQVLKTLSVPISSRKTRLLLRLLIPIGRWSVANREKSKSLTIKMVDLARKGFWTLGEQMVKEGRLPESDLVFFLDHHELSELIENRSPAILQRAVRRKRMSQELNDNKFPEISRGIPIPLNKKDDDEDTSTSDLELKGTPVSQGCVKAFARVATNLEEAAKIKAGEILIAYSTDIAWSPYFTLLSGVATELGGLLSHGAVVARECGLPCVVGVQGATSKIKTGDYILLNGNTGVLKRLELAEN